MPAIDQPYPHRRAIKKSAGIDVMSAAKKLWWRRGESNPCPKSLPHKLLRAQFLIEVVSEVSFRNKLPSPILVRVPAELPGVAHWYPAGWCLSKAAGRLMRDMADQAARAKSRFAFSFFHRLTG